MRESSSVLSLSLLLIWLAVLTMISNAITTTQSAGYKFGTFTGLPKNLIRTSKEKTAKEDKVSLGTLSVPTVGCGTIAWFSKSKEDLRELIDESKSLSCSFFDTAERYGAGSSEAFGKGWGGCESLIGEACDQNTIVATKFTPTPNRKDGDSVVKACFDSRKRLGVDSIDLYQIHMPDIVQPLAIFGIKNIKDEAYWDGIAECYKRGYIKNVGVCNYGPTLLARAAEHLQKRGVPLASNQINYSLLYRGNGAQETLDFGNSLGIRTLAYYPMAMGLLTGKHSRTQRLQGTETGKQTSKSALELAELKNQRVDPVLQIMQEIAQRRQKTIAQVALNYVVCKGAVPIPGSRTVQQLRDNAGARGWRLTAKEVMLLEIAADNLNYSFDGAGFKRSGGKFVGYGIEKWSLD